MRVIVTRPQAQAEPLAARLAASRATPAQCGALTAAVIGIGVLGEYIGRIVAETGVPVVPLALRGLWGSFFSRSVDGQAFKRVRGFFNRIELVGGALVPAGNVTAPKLEADVKALRGDMR